MALHTSDFRRTITANLSSFLVLHRQKHEYNLIVIGSGPAAQKCSIDAAKRGKRSATIGGVCVHTGTIPSKTFREAVLHLTGYRYQDWAGWCQKGRVSVGDILHRVGVVITNEKDVIHAQLLRNGITLLDGHATYKVEDAFVVPIEKKCFRPVRILRTTKCYPSLSQDHYLIASGTHPARREGLTFDAHTCFDSDQILSKNWSIPRDMIVIGAGVIGMEYASIISIIPGTRVTVIDERDQILPFADREIVDTLCHAMRQNSTRFIFAQKIVDISVYKAKNGCNRVAVRLDSEKVVHGDALLYTIGRQGNTRDMGLENTGIATNTRGLIAVNHFYQTSVPHIYAAGDCIGFPALASTSMEQGRLASCHMFDKAAFPTNYGGLKRFPYGIYTIPEVSVIGYNEETLTAMKVPYDVGVAHYKELAKGQMGGADGLLKLLFNPTTHEILGVHCIGDGATEIIHIGQTAMDMKAPIEYFRNTVFNYPTMAEAYRVAALNGLQKSA